MQTQHMRSHFPKVRGSNFLIKINNIPKNKKICLPKVGGSRLWYHKVNKEFTSAASASGKGRWGKCGKGHVCAEVHRSRTVALSAPVPLQLRCPGVHSAAMRGVGVQGVDVWACG